MKRAQISLETVLAVSLSILIFLGFFLFYLNKNTEIKKTDEILQLREECFKVSNAIESAITLGDGYTTIMTLGNTIRLDEGIILIESSKGIGTTCSYRGDVETGVYTNTISIENTNNEISIKNV